MEGTWTISELAERAVAALAADGSAQVSGRVRDLPNERLIRWYTTIGLVDPPLGRRGRTALYGPRHLLQLVAVKRRQAAGRSIAEIQLELAAATDATLEQAALPPEAAAPPEAVDSSGTDRTDTTDRAEDAGKGNAGLGAGGTGADGGADIDGAGGAEAMGPLGAESGAGSGSARAAFWSTRPDVSYTDAAVADDYGRAGDSSEVRSSVVQGVRLTPGLTLLLDVPALDGEDLAAIETAARPLLDELRRRGLIPAASPAFLSADSSRRSQ